MRRTFIEKVIENDTLNIFQEIELDIDEWHNSTSSASLYEWLGLTRDEYASYIQYPSCLEQLVQSKRQKS